MNAKKIAEAQYTWASETYTVYALHVDYHKYTLMVITTVGDEITNTTIKAYSKIHEVLDAFSDFKTAAKTLGFTETYSI